MTTSLFNTGIRPAVDNWLLEKAKEKRDYGDYWSASSAGYCQRKLIFERLGVPYVVKEDDARKQRVFTAGHLFHDWMQRITKEAGLSIAQELELQDEDLMVRGHIDDLVLVSLEIHTNKDGKEFQVNSDNKLIYSTTSKTLDKPTKHLILYDYKTRNSRNFDFSKILSYYHKMQLGTYMYMLNNSTKSSVMLGRFLEEARILNIEKDTLRMSENQLLWDDTLEKEVVDYWTSLNAAWESKKLPPCTCHVHENGFLAREKYNPYWFDGKPCSIELYKQWKKEQHATI